MASQRSLVSTCTTVTRLDQTASHEERAFSPSTLQTLMLNMSPLHGNGYATSRRAVANGLSTSGVCSRSSIGYRGTTCSGLQEILSLVSLSFLNSRACAKAFRYHCRCRRRPPKYGLRQAGSAPCRIRTLLIVHGCVDLLVLCDLQGYHHRPCRRAFDCHWKRDFESRGKATRCPKGYCCIFAGHHLRCHRPLPWIDSIRLDC